MIRGGQVVLGLALAACATGIRGTDDATAGEPPLPCLRGPCRRVDLEQALGAPDFESAADGIAMWCVARTRAGWQASAPAPTRPLDSAETMIAQCDANGLVRHWRLLSQPAPRPDVTVGATTRAEVMFACGMPALSFDDGRELVYGVRRWLWRDGVFRRAYGPTEVPGVRELLERYPFQEEDRVDPSVLRFDAAGIVIEGWR